MAQAEWPAALLGVIAPPRPELGPHRCSRADHEMRRRIPVVDVGAIALWAPFPFLGRPQVTIFSQGVRWEALSATALYSTLRRSHDAIVHFPSSNRCTRRT